MDWKYKHFAQEAVFEAEPDIVKDAVRAFARDWLADWAVAETPDGLKATGRSGLHVATATFRIEAAPVGTKLTVTLLVERASRTMGFMLVDVGGFYNGQLRKWLQALPWWVQQRQTAANPSAGGSGQAAPAAPPTNKPSAVANLFFGCLFVSAVLIVLMYFLAALVGLLTGNLFLAGRGSGGSMIYGTWARILSAVILAFFGWIAFRIWKPKQRARNRGTGWLPPP